MSILPLSGSKHAFKQKSAALSAQWRGDGRVVNAMIKGKKKHFTTKQAFFVREYLIDLNASAAARRAGYSVKSASRIGQQLLAIKHVADEIARQQAERINALGFTAEKVLKELALIGFQNSKNLFTSSGNMIPIHKLPDDVALTISSIDVVEGDVTKIRMCDKKGSLELLGKHLKLFTDKVEQSGPGGGPVEHRITNCPPDTDDLDDWLEAKDKIDRAYAKNILDTTTRPTS